MKPLMGLALAHPEQPPLHNLPGVGLPVTQDTQPPLLGGRQGAGRVRRVPPGRARLPVEASAGHLGLEGGLKGWHQLPKFLHGATGQIQELRRTGLDVGEAYMAHGCALRIVGGTGDHKSG